MLVLPPRKFVRKVSMQICILTEHHVSVVRNSVISSLIRAMGKTFVSPTVMIQYRDCLHNSLDLHISARNIGSPRPITSSQRRQISSDSTEVEISKGMVVKRVSTVLLTFGILEILLGALPPSLSLRKGMNIARGGGE